MFFRRPVRHSGTEPSPPDLEPGMPEDIFSRRIGPVLLRIAEEYGLRIEDFDEFRHCWLAALREAREEARNTSGGEIRRKEWGG